MSKETQLGTPCPGCNNVITFVDYHIDHCKNYKYIIKPTKKKKKNKRK